jgi:hypothetical protein
MIQTLRNHDDIETYCVNACDIASIQAWLPKHTAAEQLLKLKMKFYA